jgi:hypothetical protein
VVKIEQGKIKVKFIAAIKAINAISLYRHSQSMGVVVTDQ